MARQDWHRFKMSFSRGYRDIKTISFVFAAAMMAFAIGCGGNIAAASETDVRIKLAFDGGEAIVKMRDNPTSRDFLSLLPLSLEFKDYAATEKISDLPKKLSLEAAPPGFDPDLGDLTLYAPWGNLAIFYKDRGYADGLIPLGHIESGVEKLANMGGDFTAVAEKID
jgi:hypothetical protein